MQDIKTARIGIVGLGYVGLPLAIMEAKSQHAFPVCPEKRCLSCRARFDGFLMWKTVCIAAPCRSKGCCRFYLFEIQFRISMTTAMVG